MTTDRESLRRRIAALLAKTVERGCTEEEAIAAASVAARLMRDHGISEAELQMDQQSARARSRGNSSRDPLWRIIAYCTNTAPLVDATSGLRRVFIGIEPGPSIAVYLYVVCDRAIDRALREFKESSIYRRRRSLEGRRRAARDFTIGMVGRLALRLTTLFADTVSDDARKRALAARDEMFPDMRPVKCRTVSARSSAAASAGYAAGQNVNLSHGVGGSDAPLVIGGEM